MVAKVTTEVEVLRSRAADVRSDATPARWICLRGCPPAIVAHRARIAMEPWRLDPPLLLTSGARRSRRFALMCERGGVAEDARRVEARDAPNAAAGPPATSAACARSASRGASSVTQRSMLGAPRTAQRIELLVQDRMSKPPCGREPTRCVREHRDRRATGYTHRGSPASSIIGWQRSADSNGARGSYGSRAEADRFRGRGRASISVVRSSTRARAAGPSGTSRRWARTGSST